MHELMMNCLYLFAIILSILGITGVLLILIGAVDGIIVAISHHGGNHE